MGSDAITSSKSFLTYLLTASSLAVLSVLLLPGHRDGDAIASPFLRLYRTARVWPRLELSWRSALATAVGFLGSAFGTVGGVGGGGIFVPLLNLVVGFDTKSAAALSKCMIMGASMSSVWYNLRVPHPSREVPIIDYDLALLFQPMLMLGITIGVSLSVVFPYWLITVLIIILFMGTSSRSFFMAIHMWKQETLLKMEVERRMENPEGNTEGNKEALIDATEPLLSEKERTIHEILGANLRWKGIFVLMLVWSSFLLLQFLKARKKIPSAESAMVLAINFILFLQNGAPVCGALYWVVNILQFPVSVAVYVWEAMKLYRGSRRRRMGGNLEHVCEASIEWTPLQLLFCAFCGILGGTVGGLLGSGGGFILGPLLLEIGVIPQVASATATFVMMFSSSLSVVEFYFLKRFPIPYAAYLMFVSIIAGFWGQYLVRQLVLILRRASVIVFILSSVIFTSALVMGVIGIQTSIEMIKQHKYMGFLSFCDS